MGAYYLHPPDSRAIFLHNELLCNDTCFVNGGAKRTGGKGANGKDPKFQGYYFGSIRNCIHNSLLCFQAGKISKSESESAIVGVSVGDSMTVDESSSDLYLALDGIHLSPVDPQSHHLSLPLFTPLAQDNNVNVVSVNCQCI